MWCSNTGWGQGRTSMCQWTSLVRHSRTALQGSAMQQPWLSLMTRHGTRRKLWCITSGALQVSACLLLLLLLVPLVPLCLLILLLLPACLPACFASSVTSDCAVTHMHPSSQPHVPPQAHPNQLLTQPFNQPLTRPLPTYS